MRFQSIVHKGLRRFVELDDPRGLVPETLERVRNILTFLEMIKSEDDLRLTRQWNAHQLVGSRKGTWSLKVNANWRITFKISQESPDAIQELDYEDYH
jgi:proteic killer suppression protein